MHASAPSGLVPLRGDVAAAALLLTPFVLFEATILTLVDPSPERRAAADPLIRLLDASGGGAWFAILIVGATCTAWGLAAEPSRAQLERGVRLALLGALAATLAALALRLAFGAHLPAAIPPEESAKPGLALGLAAGLLEEALFRLFAMPLLLGLALRRLPERPAALVAIAVSGLLFALSHELAPGAAFDARHFAVRALLPGALMSGLFLRPGPAFIVSAHATAHLWIPALFR